MAISIVQTPAGVISGYDTVAVSFASTPTVGNTVLAVVIMNPDYSGLNLLSSTTVTDNQSNSYTTAFADSQDGGLMFAWAPINTASGTFTVTATMPGSSESGAGLWLFEVSGLDNASLIDSSVSVTLENQLNFSTTFNVTTGTPSQADELILAACNARGFGSGNSISPPTDYTEHVERTSGDAVGYICYRIISSAAAQSINLSGFPQDGDPAMMVRGFKMSTGGGGGITVAWLRA